jgi:large subunit ribosomal protein L35
MPKLKMKTRSSAKKRYRITGSGKIRSQGAGASHIRGRKTKAYLKEKMRLQVVDKTNISMLRALLPNGIKGRKIRVGKQEMKEDKA